MIPTHDCYSVILRTSSQNTRDVLLENFN